MDAPSLGDRKVPSSWFHGVSQAGKTNEVLQAGSIAKGSL